MATPRTIPRPVIAPVRSPRISAARVQLWLARLGAWRAIVINGGAVMALAAIFATSALAVLIALGWY